MTKAEVLRDMLTAWLLEFGDRPVSAAEFMNKPWHNTFGEEMSRATGPSPEGGDGDGDDGYFRQISNGWVMSQKGLDFIKGEDL